MVEPLLAGAPTTPETAPPRPPRAGGPSFGTALAAALAAGGPGTSEAADGEAARAEGERPGPQEARRHGPRPKPRASAGAPTAAGDPAAARTSEPTTARPVADPNTIPAAETPSPQAPRAGDPLAAPAAASEPAAPTAGQAGPDAGQAVAKTASNPPGGWTALPQPLETPAPAAPLGVPVGAAANVQDIGTACCAGDAPAAGSGRRVGAPATASVDVGPRTRSTTAMASPPATPDTTARSSPTATDAIAATVAPFTAERPRTTPAAVLPASASTDAHDAVAAAAARAGEPQATLPAGVRPPPPAGRPVAETAAARAAAVVSQTPASDSLPAPALPAASAPITGADAAGPIQGSPPEPGAPREYSADATRAEWRPQRPQPLPGLQAGAPPAMAMVTPTVSGALAALEGLERLRGRESAADALAAASAAQPAPAVAAQGLVAAPLESPAPAPPATAPTPTLVQPVPVDAPEFPLAFAGQVESLLLEGVDSARILVTPREMGPIRIELSVSGESATVAFSAAQPETRQAIEQTLPALRTLLSEHGLELAHASVGQGDGGQSQRREPPGRFGVDAPPTTRHPEPTGGAEAPGPRVPAARPSRLVDLFA